METGTPQSARKVQSKARITFSDLPKELRERIWQFVLPPRVMKFQHHEPPTEGDGYFTHSGNSTVMRICHEARITALRSYQPLQDTTTQELSNFDIYWNPAVDIVLLPHIPWFGGMLREEKSEAKNFLEDVKMAKRIAFFDSENLIDSLYISLYESLEQLFIIEDPDRVCRECFADCGSIGTLNQSRPGCVGNPMAAAGISRELWGRLRDLDEVISKAGPQQSIHHFTRPLKVLVATDEQGILNDTFIHVNDHLPDVFIKFSLLVQAPKRS
ncbi:hypothetical protein BP5796_03813 [Coleophoma crateriformis]|uniref:2EXR domain-containing protein n=1 Tax=Coleophoma crateriformis TaxID=565419 RepID=A0A3D8SI88_9HELO|nr:hypothetical protein BP5796_03813 [Coleophoma crateriformis]